MCWLMLYFMVTKLLMYVCGYVCVFVGMCVCVHVFIHQLATEPFDIHWEAVGL